jgi:hypothetical protein
VIASVSVDSLAGRAPVTNITEVLQARTPGVQIIPGIGLTGASPSIRIRGTSSLSLSNEPLIIVDGVRVDNSAQPGAVQGASVVTTRVNRFGAFNADDIESIDIIKGPSRPRCMGPPRPMACSSSRRNAERPGRTRWTLYGEAGQVSQPADLRRQLIAPGGATWSVVSRRPGPVTCRLSDQSPQSVRGDSVTTFNPLMNSETTPFKTQPRYLFGAQASGGNSAFTFFLSAEHEDETGPYRMPDAEITRLTTARGAEAARRADRAQQPGADESARQLRRAHRLQRPAQLLVRVFGPNALHAIRGRFLCGLWFQTYFAPGFRTPTNGTSAQYIGDIFSVTQKLRDQRLTGAARSTGSPSRG